VDDSSEEALAATLEACRTCVRSVQAPAGMLADIEAAMEAAGRGLHSFTLEINLSTSRTHS